MARHVTPQNRNSICLSVGQSPKAEIVKFRKLTFDHELLSYKRNRYLKHEINLEIFHVFIFEVNNRQETNVFCHTI